MIFHVLYFAGLACPHRSVRPRNVPDPSSTGKELPKHKKSTLESKTGTVVFTPDDIRPRKKKNKKNVKTEL